jgi:flagellar capping protein FliD
MTLQKGLVIGAFAVVLAVANANAQTAAQPNTSSPTATVSVSADVPVRALISAMQAQDAVAIRAQFAPTATQAYGADGKMKDPAATAKWLESDIIKRRGKVEDPEFTVNGNEVVVRGQYNAVGYTNKANFLFTVENGLITSWRMRY